MENNKSFDNDKRGNDSRNRAKSFNGNYSKEHKNGFMHLDDDEIYDEAPKRRNDMGPSSKSQSQKGKFDKSKSYPREIQDTNFYDEDDMMVIKTVKRKEILKQYYSSGTDTELSSSDPYDCIIVDDHLGPSTSTFRNRNSYAAESDKRGSIYKHDVSGTLLPRTKLSKSARTDSSEQFDMNDRMNTAKSNKTNKSNFGPWSNLWPDEKSFN
jgi:hypothetical protein